MSRSALPSRVKVVEVGPRDGLQNERTPVPTAAKTAFIEALAAAGLPFIEITAFVNPSRVPQMADASEVAIAVRRQDGIRYGALVPNARGLAAAAAAGMTDIAVFAAASETFSRRNINQTIDQSLETYAGVVDHVLPRVRRYACEGPVKNLHGCTTHRKIPGTRSNPAARCDVRAAGPGGWSSALRA